MATKTIPVNWVNGAPSVPDTTVTPSDGTTTVTWTAGKGVATITVSGLNPPMFTGFSGQGTGTVSCTDQNDNASNKDYQYNVQVTPTKGDTVIHDPKIYNVGRGTPPLRPEPRKPEPRP